MQLIPTYAGSFHAPWPPADVLRRVGDKTARTEERALGGWLTTRAIKFSYIHQFSGIISTDEFRIQRLGMLGGRGSLFQVGSALQPSLLGRVQAAPDGGTRLELSYRGSSLWLIGLILSCLVLFCKALIGGQSLGYALSQVIGICTVGWLLAQAFFWADVRRWRAELVELLQLKPLPPA